MVTGSLSGNNLPTTIYGTIPDELKAAAKQGYLKKNSVNFQNPDRG